MPRLLLMPFFASALATAACPSALQRDCERLTAEWAGLGHWPAERAAPAPVLTALQWRGGLWLGLDSARSLDQQLPAHLRLTRTDAGFEAFQVYPLLRWQRAF